MDRCQPNHVELESACGLWRHVSAALLEEIRAGGKYTCIGGCATPLTAEEAAGQ